MENQRPSKHLYGPVFFALIILIGAAACGDVVSDFEDGFQGWTVVEPFNAFFLHETVDGNPGGFIRAYDTLAGGGSLVISAPQEYTGNLTGAISFSFDAYIYRDGSQTDPGVTSEPKVWLISGDTRYRHTWTEEDGRLIAQWQTLTVPMQSSEWTLDQGGLYTGSLSFAQVLSDVDEIRLLLDMHWDWTTRYEIGIDNVTLVQYKVTSPNGGEVLIPDTTFDITWLAPAISQTTDMEYSIDDGSNWDYIDQVVDSNSYTWPVPDVNSSLCLVRVSDPVNSLSDVSDNVFQIQHGIVVDAPNGGEDVLSESVYDVQWRASAFIEEVMIEYTTNDGADWFELEPNTINDGVYEWSVWDSYSDQCRVRISDANDPGVTDTSDALFTIHGPLLVQSPNGGEALMPGTVHSVQWDSSESIADVLIEYSIDNGSNWTPVAPPNTGNTGAYDWLVPASSSDQCLLRVSDVLGAGIYDTSDSAFTILSLNLLSPNGGQCLMSGTTTPIEWASFGTASTVLIEYSLDGWAWTAVSPPNTGNTGSYTWTVPEVNASYCRVRISDVAQPAYYYTSDMFPIYQCQRTPTDLDGSCYVDIDDAVIFAINWLSTGCGSPGWCSGADFDLSTAVNYVDFSVFAQDWQFCGNACDPACLVENWPVSWDWDYQCRGDADGQEEVMGKAMVRVYSDDLTVLTVAFGTTYPEPDYNPSADFDRDGDVDQDDEDILTANFGKTSAQLTTCPEGGIWPPRF